MQNKNEKYIHENGKLHMVEPDNHHTMVTITYQQHNDGSYEILSTVTKENYQGQGLAKKALYHLVFDVFEKNSSIIATCPYAKHVLEKDEVIAPRLLQLKTN